MSIVDSKIVEMQFDNRQFEQNVQTSLTTLDTLKQSLNFEGVTKGFDGLGNAAKNLKFGRLADDLKGTIAQFNLLDAIGVATLMRIANRAVDAGEKLVKSLSVDNIAAGWKKFGEKTSSVATLVAQGYALETVNTQLEKLNWFTDETSYNFTDMVNNISKFTASGQNLEDSVTAMQGIANWAALSGQNATTASRAMYQLSQAMGAGTMRREDYRSIQNASMDTMEFRQKALDAAVALGTLKKNSDDTYTSIVEGATESTFTIKQFANNLTNERWFTSDVMMEVFKTYSSAVDTLYEFAEANDLTATQILEGRKAVEEGGKAFDEYFDSLERTDIAKDDLKKFVKGLDEFGIKAFKAAQEARTFRDVIDATQDAVSTAWMNTFEIIFGDYKEATSLWTAMANELYDVFAEPVNQLNDLLQGSLRDTLMTLGFSDIGPKALGMSEVGWEAFKKLLTETAKEHDISIDKMIESTGSFEKSLREGWLTGDLLVETIDKISEAELKNEGYTDEEIKKLQRLAKAAETAGTPINKLLEGVSETSGRDLLLQSFGNIYEAITNIADALGEAWSSIFPPVTSDQLYSFIEGFRDFTEKLKLSDETLDKLKRTFKGVFAVIDIGKQALTAVADTVIPIITNAFSSLGGTFLENGANLGDYLVKLSESIRENETFTKAMAKIGEVLSTIFATITSAIEQIVPKIAPIVSFVAENIVSPSWELFSTILEKISGTLQQLATDTEPIRNKLGELFKGLVDTIKNNHILDLIGRLWDILKQVGGVVLEKVGKAIGFVADKIKNAKFENIIEFINAISGLLVGSGLAGIGSFFSSMKKIPTDNPLTAIMDVLKNFKENGFKGLGDALANALSGITNPLKEMQQALKSESIKAIATSILILAGALFVVSMIDKDALGRSVAAMAGLFGELAGTMKILNGAKMGRGAASGMIAMALSIAILAASLKIISDIQEDQLAVAVLAILELVMTLVAASKAMSLIGGNKAAKGLGGFILMAISLRIMVGALKSVAELTDDKLKTGIKGISALLAEMTIAMVVMKQGKNFKIGDAASFIAFAFAISILTRSLKSIAEIKDKESFEQALTGISALIMEMGIAMMAMSSTKSHFTLRDSIAFIAFAGAIKILSGILEDLAKIKWTSLTKALVAISALLWELTGVMLLMGNNETATFTNAMSFVVIAASLKILAGVVEQLAEMDAGQLVKAIFALGVLIGLIYTFADGLQGNFGSAASLILMAVAINMFVPAVTALGAIPLANLAKGLIAFGITLGVVALAAKALTGSELALLAFAGAVVSIGASVFLAGAGIMLLASGITLLGSAMASGVANIITGLKEIIIGFVTMLPDILGALKETIPSIVDFLLTVLLTTLNSMKDYLPQIVSAVLELVLGILKAAREHIPEIVIEAVGFLGDIFIAIGEAIASYSGGDLENMALGIGVLSGILVACAGFSTIAAAAMAGIVEVGVAVTEIGVLLAAFGALEQIPGVNWIIEQGSNLLNKIGEAIGGFIGSIVGGLAAGATNSLEKVGTNLSDFVTAAAPFFAMVETMSKAVMDNGLDSSKILEFKENIGKFAECFTEFDVGTADINSEKISIINTLLANLRNVLGNLNGLDSSGIDKLQEAFSKLSELSIDELTTKLESGKNDVESAANSLVNSLVSAFGNVPDISSEITNMMQGIVNQVLRSGEMFSNIGKQLASKLSNGISSGLGASNVSASSGVTAMMDSSLSAVTSQYKQFGEAGKNAMSYLAVGIRTSSPAVVAAVRLPMTSSLVAIRSYYAPFNTAGVYLVKGFANGIASSTYMASLKAKAMANAAKNAAKKALDEHSPSKEMAKIGLYAVLGFVNELTAGEKTAYNAAYSMANGALAGTEKASSRISSIIEDSIDAQPTIRPVLDLTEIQNGADSMSSMLNLDPTIGMSNNLGAISSMMMLKPSSATNDDVVSAINALRKTLGTPGDNIVINGVTYDDGSNINDAVRQLVRAARVERRA